MLHQKAILAYDSECKFCSSIIRFVIRFDKKKQIQFVSLQSKVVKRIFGQSAFKRDTVLYLEEGRMYKRSSAIIKLLLRLGGIWKVFILAYILPVSIRDYFYKVIAKNRFRIFGKTDECLLSNPELESRFISD